MRIQLSNGLLHFYQWDTGQKVKAPEGVETIHFRIDNDHAAPITVTNGWATVPDECFQSGDDLVYYAYDENHTTDSARVEVVERPKPTGYAYTQTEIKTWESLDKRIKALETGGTGSGGLSTAQVTALDNMFKIAAYTEDASSAYAAFQAAFGLSGGDTPGAETWSITNTLTNATTSNSATSVTKGGSYSATITAEEGYTISIVTVTMGGTDITATAYANGVITIASVTGNVTITVETTASGGGDQLVTNGLMAYFDFRTAEYNNDNNGLTTISPTSGNGELFVWAKNCIATQDGYGIHPANTRAYMYDASGGTTATDYSGALTLLVLTKGHVAYQGFRYTNVERKWAFAPKYNSTAEAQNIAGTVSKEGYNYCVYRVDGASLLLRMNDATATYTGTDISGFKSWVATVNIGAQAQQDTGVYIVGAAIYNRALTDVEIEDMRAFFQTLEVSE
nr:MAG TPA: hypothetical protein [Bacteriophage sp.]